MQSGIAVAARSILIHGSTIALFGLTLAWFEDSPGPSLDADDKAMTPTDPTRLDAQLRPLQLPYIRRDYLALASKAPSSSARARSLPRWVTWCR